MAETVIDLYQDRGQPPARPWRHLDHVEFATLEWDHWFNTTRLLEPIGDIPPADREAIYYRQHTTPAPVT